MSILGFGEKQKTIDELEEETENLEAQNRRADGEMTLLQKKVAIARLKEQGLSPKHFPDWASIKQWLKTH